MIIQTGRARIQINSGVYTVAMAAPVIQNSAYTLTPFLAGSNGYIAIPITKSANSLIYASAVSLLVLGGSLFL